MNASAVNLWIAPALALIVVIASVRQLRADTAHPGHRWVVIALQIIVATLLYFCLAPPPASNPQAGWSCLAPMPARPAHSRPAKARCCCCRKLPMCPARSAYPTWPPRCASIRPPR